MSLTNEDKEWMREQFAERFAELRTWTGEQLAELRTWTGEQLAALRIENHRDIEAAETKLLTAFHDWASSIERRVRSHSAVLRAIDADLEYLKARIAKVEKFRAAQPVSHAFISQ